MVELGAVELGHVLVGQVAPFGDGPLVVGLDDDRGDEARDAGVVGEEPDDVGAPLDLAVDPLERVGGLDLAPAELWERGEGEEVLGGVSEHGGDGGELAAEQGTERPSSEHRTPGTAVPEPAFGVGNS